MLQIENHKKACQNLVKWDEYRVRRDAIIAMYIEARQRLAMKKVMVLLSTFHAIMNEIWGKYRIKYLFRQMRNTKEMAVSRIKGVFKLNMVRRFAQYKIRRQL